jgi:hypothetical protein
MVVTLVLRRVEKEEGRGSRERRVEREGFSRGRRVEKEDRQRERVIEKVSSSQRAERQLLCRLERE